MRAADETPFTEVRQAMSADDFSPSNRMQLRTMRIIHAVLLMGCLGIAVFMVVMRARGNRPVTDPPVVSLVGLALAGVMGLTALVVPNVLAANWRQKIVRGVDPQPRAQLSSPQTIPGQSVDWWGLYQTRMIIVAALLDEVIFFGLIAYLIEGPLWNLGIAALFLVGLALLFPTRERVERWISVQQELVELQKRTAL